MYSFVAVPLMHPYQFLHQGIQQISRLNRLHHDPERTDHVQDCQDYYCARRAILPHELHSRKLCKMSHCEYLWYLVLFEVAAVLQHQLSVRQRVFDQHRVSLPVQHQLCLEHHRIQYLHPVECQHRWLHQLDAEVYCG